MGRSKSKKILATIFAAGLLLVSPTATIPTANNVHAATTNSAVISYGTKLPRNSYVTVGYRPHRSINIWITKDGRKYHRSGRHLSNGSTVRTYNVKKVGHTSWYYLGRNKWLNSSHLVPMRLVHTKYHVLKKNANSRQYYTSQYFPVFAPWGCASSSLSRLMKYDGSFKKVPGGRSERAKLTYMQNHLPRNKRTGGQDGNPYTGAGFTRVIQSYRLTQYAHQLGDQRIRDISGVSLNNIKKLVLNGHPVLYYGYSSYDAAGYRNHCKVIMGYSAKRNKFLVHDPLYQAKRFYRGGGGRNSYDLGPIAWVSYSHINREFSYRGGNNALTIR